MSKHKHWNKEMFDMIEGKAMGSLLRKMKDIEVINVIKMVHGWKYDGYQKDLFHENNDEFECPAGCGQTGR